jgi:mitogen-activated protein kinase kinase kinase
VNNGEGARPGQPTLEQVLRHLVKFVNSEDGTTKTVDVSDCSSGFEVLVKVLRKFNKWNTGNHANPGGDTDGDDDRLEVDGWGVFVRDDNPEEGMASSARND